MPARSTKLRSVEVARMPAAQELADDILVERARAGDGSAREAIYVRYSGHVKGLCTRLLRSAADVEDVVQDTFIDAFEQLAAVREPDRLRHWITGIAVHKAHRRFRRRRLASLFGLAASRGEFATTLAPRPALCPELRAELVRLDRALQPLPDEVRACWLLRYVDGYSLAEVAELCSCSLATAKRRIAHAAAMLADHVQVPEVTDE